MLKPDDLARWRAGDSDAATTVSVWVRGRADRILRHAALLEAAGPGVAAQLRDRETRGAWTGRVAQEVMAREVGDPKRLEVMVVASTALLAVDALRDGRVWEGGAEHLERRSVVRAAMAPARREPAVVTHMKSCTHCFRDVSLLQVITGRLPKPLSASAAGPSFKATLSPARVFSRWTILPAAVFLLIGAWAFTKMDDTVGWQEEVSLEDLAERHPPKLHSISQLPPGVQQVIADLARGDCFAAGARVRSLRRAHPNVAQLYVVEAQSMVCAGEPQRALDALEDLEEAGMLIPRGGHWAQAQAHLLLDQGPEALDALGKARLSDDRRRALAIDQARLIRKRLGEAL